jgi:plasmid maintenance system antidote protein VapI
MRQTLVGVRSPVRSFDPDWRVAPGEALADVLDELELTVDDLRDAIGETAEALLAGAAPLTPEIAEQLHELTHVTAQFWLNLEAEYHRPITKKETDA